MIDPATVARYIEDWGLQPAGEQITTHTSTLCAALCDGKPVMLKLTEEPDELLGARVLAWWDGDGAARVLEIDEPAILMERAHGSRSLYNWSLGGRDEAAIDVLCEVVSKLHRVRQGPLPETVPLEKWFAPLLDSDPSDAFVQVGKKLAGDLLADARDLVVLHGDIHHRNVLDSGDGRWVAIDPKGLHGERAFDYVNIFRNPEFEIASDSDRFLARLRQVKSSASIDPERLLRWIAAFCALSVVWDYYPEGSAEHDRTIGQLALRVLAGGG